MTADLVADPVLRTFAICAAILTLEMGLMVTLIGVLRNLRAVYINPEDYRFTGRSSGGSDEMLERVRRAHSNDGESIPVLLAIGLLFALTTPSPPLAFWVFVVFTGSRFLHTVFYVAALQPWRSVIYAVGAVALAAMPVVLIWRTMR